jgi:hypothetical protein
VPARRLQGDVPGRQFRNVCTGREIDGETYGRADRFFFLVILLTDKLKFAIKAIITKLEYKSPDNVQIPPELI